MRESHTHIHLDYSRIKFLFCIKKRVSFVNRFGSKDQIDSFLQNERLI